MVLSSTLVARSSLATETDLPSVTIDKIDYINGWFDFGSKRDFFARVRLIDPLGNSVSCGTTPVIEDIAYSRPGVTLCNPIGVPGTIRVTRPFRIILEVWEADGPGSPPGMDPSLQVDLSSGVEKHVTIGPFNSPTPSKHNVIVVGPEVSVELTVETVPFPTRFTTAPMPVPATFDPVLGETTRIAVALDDPTPLTMFATEIATGRQIQVLHTLPQMAFNLEWDGRDTLGGTPMPYGDYAMQLVGPGGAPRLDWKVTLGPAPELQFIGYRLDTPNNVNVRAIHPRVAFTIADASNVRLMVAQADPTGLCIFWPAAVVRTIDVNLQPGTHRLEWDGRADDGTWVGPDNYCVTLVANRLADGRRYTSAIVQMVVIAPSPIYVDVRTQPEIPALSPGQPVMVRARTFDHQGNPRPVYNLALAATDLLPAGQVPPMNNLGTCRGVAECVFPLRGAMGTAALNAVASDEDLNSSESGLRLVDLVRPAPGVDIRVSVAARMEGATIFEQDRKHAIDIAFHRTTDLETTTDGVVGAGAFSISVGRQIDALLGFNGRGPSVIHEFIKATNFWAVSTPAVVTHGSGPFPNDTKDLCHVASASWSSSSDVNAVLHLVDCRDNAISRHFTSIATQFSTGWHEVHHRPFQEDDEYCCDSSYTPHPDEPNIYRSMIDCQSRSSSPATCRQITDGSMPPQTVNYFVSDPPTNDVMVDAGIERADDLRRMRAHYADCVGGNC